MNKQRSHILLENYFSGKITDEEKQELAGMLDSEEGREFLENEFKVLWDKSPAEDAPILDAKIKKEMLSEIFSDARSKEEVHRKPFRKFYLRIAATAASLLIVLAAGLLYRNFTDANRKPPVLVATAAHVASSTPTAYTRNLTLPDGSAVVLKAGSTLSLAPNFAGSTREVSLSGEAYFDIVHEESRPFIIHTGKVKTTVLGTAFNIKAWPQQHNVTVSVTRGKVRVEDEQKILALLTKDQEVFYDQARADAKTKPVAAEKVVNDWATQDMVFRNMSFFEIAQVLSKRYGVDIEIEGKELAEMEMVSSFSGTESLEMVLSILCGIDPDVHYVMNNGKVIISSGKSVAK